MVHSIANFSQALTQFNKREALPGSLQKKFEIFCWKLAKDNPKTNEANLFKAFAKKYNLEIHSQYKASVLAYTKIFLKMFPKAKFEDQNTKFKLAHRKENPFVAQWDSINEFIRNNPNELVKQLDKIFSKISNFDKQQFEIRALLDAKAKITPSVVDKALACNDPRYFALLLSYGCDVHPGAVQIAVQHNDSRFFELVLTHRKISSLDPFVSARPFENRDERLIRALNAGIKITCATISNAISSDDMQFLKFLLSNGCKISQDDFNVLCNNFEQIEKVVPYLELFKENRYVFSDEDRLKILSKYLSKIRPGDAAEYAYPAHLGERLKRELIKESVCPSPVFQRLIAIVCPTGELDSPSFQKLHRYALSLLALGYKPTEEDLKWTVSQKNLEAVKAIALYKHNAFSHEEVFAILSLNMKRETNGGLFRFFSMTAELFREMLLKRPNDIGVFVKEPVLVDEFTASCYQNSGLGNYQVTEEDLAYAIDIKVDGHIFDLLLYWSDSTPHRSLFQKVLKENPDREYLRALIHKEYKVDSLDFRYACDLKSEESIFHLLVNQGWGSECNDEMKDIMQYTDVRRFYPVFKAERAGYIPAEDDLKYARERGCDEKLSFMTQPNV